MLQPVPVINQLLTDTSTLAQKFQLVELKINTIASLEPTGKELVDQLTSLKSTLVAIRKATVSLQAGVRSLDNYNKTILTTNALAGAATSSATASIRTSSGA